MQSTQNIQVEGGVCEVDLLHPELMPLDDLKRIISQKTPHVSNIEESTEADLLEIYYKMVMPLPQRVYGRNRRGVRLSSKTVIVEEVKSDCTLSNTITDEKCRNSIKLSRSADFSSRLKPPPTDLSSNKKIINLTQSKFHVDAGTSVKRTNSSVSDSGKKIMKLINNTLQSSLKLEPHEKLAKGNESSSEEVMPPRKKHKPIMWP